MDMDMDMDTWTRTWTWTWTWTYGHGQDMDMDMDMWTWTWTWKSGADLEGGAPGPLVKKFVQILLTHPNKNIPWAYQGISMVQCHMQLHGESMGIPMDIHRNTMEFSWSILWSFHGILE